MGENSSIEWTHHTFNPWTGCQKVSPGCNRCYAERQNAHWKWNGGTWGPHAPRQRTSQSNWNKPLAWNREAARAHVRHRVFCASLADWLDNRVSQQWRVDLACLIEATPQLDWLLLTKRIENYWRLAPWVDVPGNVWLGVTCEDQQHFERRWDLLSGIAARVRFISYEPALGPLTLRDCPSRPEQVRPDWIICGGESGPGSRCMDRNGRARCAMNAPPPASLSS